MSDVWYTDVKLHCAHFSDDKQRKAKFFSRWWSSDAFIRLITICVYASLTPWPSETLSSACVFFFFKKNGKRLSACKPEYFVENTEGCSCKGEKYSWQSIQCHYRDYFNQMFCLCTLQYIKKKVQWILKSFFVPQPSPTKVSLQLQEYISVENMPLCTFFAVSSSSPSTPTSWRFYHRTRTGPWGTDSWGNHTHRAQTLQRNRHKETHR